LPNWLSYMQQMAFINKSNFVLFAKLHFLHSTARDSSRKVNQ
jgi:hypothetical protein